MCQDWETGAPQRLKTDLGRSLVAVRRIYFNRVILDEEACIQGRWNRRVRRWRLLEVEEIVEIVGGSLIGKT